MRSATCLQFAGSRPIPGFHRGQWLSVLCPVLILMDGSRKKNPLEDKFYNFFCGDLSQCLLTTVDLRATGIILVPRGPREQLHGKQTLCTHSR